MNCRSLLFASAIATTAVACSQGADPQPAHTGGFACPLVELAPPTLYVPIPGATGVSTSTSKVIVGPPIDGTFSIAVASASPIPLGSASAVASPPPSPLATGETYYAVPLPALSPSTTYTITYTAPQSTSPCGSDESGGTIGSFTTS